MLITLFVTGDSAKGVYVCRHADVMLKFVESFKSTEIRIIIHKVRYCYIKDI